MQNSLQFDEIFQNSKTINSCFAGTPCLINQGILSHRKSVNDQQKNRFFYIFDLLNMYDIDYMTNNKAARNVSLKNRGKI